MKNHVRIAALAVASLLVTACGDDGVSPGTLSEAEAQELAGAIFSQSLFSALALNYQQPAQAPGGPQLATYQATVDATGPCPMGGQVSISGLVDVETDDQTGAGTIDFGITLVHAACGVQGESGKQFTLTGNPSLVFDFLMTTDGQDNLAFDGSISGGVDWAADGGSGTCSIAYEFSGDFSASGSGSFQTAGNVCGHTFTQNVTIG